MNTNYFRSASCVMLLLLNIILYCNVAAAKDQLSDSQEPPKLNCAVNIPGCLKSHIIRQDFENESIFSLDNGNKPAFLFSVTKVSGEQWITLKGQLNEYSIIENRDGFITFVQKTNVSGLKGDHASEYQDALQQVDGMIRSIQLN